jgi:transcriptional regulator with XRE-family HTH domain
MDFGDRLKALRNRAGLSQEALARSAGLSTSNVSKLEQKKVIPSWPTVQALARALGVSLDALADDGPVEAQPAKGKGGKRRL